MLKHWKDDDGNNWYKFRKKDIDLFTEALYDQKFEEIVNNVEE
mgnify:CR=1 FL=1|tara:strand:+ start:1248 stop:1376 length:129 start_codon:yes stop_codon:yes gene_type:complete